MDTRSDNMAFHVLMRNRRMETIHSREASLDDVFVEIHDRQLT